MTKSNKKILIVALIAVALLAVVIVAGCTSSNSGTTTASVTPTASGTAGPKEYVTLRVMNTSGTVDIIDIAAAKGYFDEQGIKIKNVGSVSGGTQVVQALVSGQIDVGASAWAPWINAVKSGGKVKVVAADLGISKNYPGILWLVHKNSSINGAKDLAGKKIAVNVLGAEADYVTQQYLKQNGVAAASVQQIVVPWPQQPQTFASNQVDVVVANTPYSDLILNSGDARVLFSDYDIKGTTAMLGYGMSESFIRQNPDVVKRFVTAVAKASDWATAHPEDAKALVREIYRHNGGNPDFAQYYNSGQAWPHELIKDSDVQWWLDVLEQNGQLTAGQFKPSDIYTNAYNPYNGAA